MNMTDPKILEAERDGLPEGTPERYQCDLCKEYHIEGNLKDVVLCTECQERAAGCDIAQWDRKILVAAMRLAVESLRSDANRGEAVGILTAALNQVEEKTE